MVLKYFKKGYGKFWSDTKEAWNELPLPLAVFMVIYGTVFSGFGLSYVMITFLEEGGIIES